ncbi:MAG: glycosyltransferase family 4 protein [Puniceicoccaceae bacterium]
MSLWKGGGDTEIPVRRFRLRSLLRLFYLLPAWMIRNPGALCHLLGAVIRRPSHSILSAQETFLGIGAGVVMAAEVRHRPPAWIHAIWATAPATAAWTIHLLTGARFSFGAHAYDLFQNGGDCLLDNKIRAAAWIRTSTTAAADELVRRGAAPGRVVLVRRGLESLPPPAPPRPAGAALRLLSVGRLVRKKGFADQIDLYAELLRRGESFEATLVGEGPLRRELAGKIRRLGLGGRVRMAGALPHDRVEALLRTADLFLFTGRVSRDGDRDGLPNVIPEAMAAGVPVAARPAPGVREAVIDGETGLLLDEAGPAEKWADQILALWRDFPSREKMSTRARAWVEDHFLAVRNTARLAERFAQSGVRPNPPEEPAQPAAGGRTG